MRNTTDTIIPEATRAKESAEFYITEFTQGIFIIEKGRHGWVRTRVITAEGVANLFRQLDRVALESNGRIYANFEY